MPERDPDLQTLIREREQPMARWHVPRPPSVDNPVDEPSWPALSTADAVKDLEVFFIDCGGAS